MKKEKNVKIHKKHYWDYWRTHATNFAQQLNNDFITLFMFII